MILFLKDYAEYPTAFPDMTTKNESFIRFAALLKSMEVKNYYFHLTLLNPKLQGVDPYDPNLTMEQKTWIALECELNYWYFIREVVRIPQEGGGVDRFRANRGNISACWSQLNCLDYAQQMPRQTGKSVPGDIFDIWLLMYYYKKAEIFLLTKDADLRIKNIRKIKEIIRELPSYLNRITKKDADNTEVVTCLARETLITAKIGSMNIDIARKMGRGHSLLKTRSDEVAYIPNVHISIPAMLAAGTKTRQRAKKTNLIYGNLFSTTAGDLSSDEGRFAYALIYDGMPWDEKLYDCKDKEELHETVRANSSGIGYNVNGTFNHRQLGYSDEWLKTVIAESRQSKTEAEKDFMNKWSKGDLRNPLSRELLEAISLSTREPEYTHITQEKYAMRWYIKEHEIDKIMNEEHHVITLDSGNAVGKDANAITLLNIKDLSVTMTCRVVEANLYKYAIWLANFLIRYENVTLIFENKSTGQMIMDTIAVILVKYGINPFKRVYNKIVDEYTNKETDYDIIRSREGLKEDTYLYLKNNFGFHTAGDNRKFLYNQVLQESVSSTGHLIKDTILIEEISSLVEKNGRVDHATGRHDDMVISWLLGHWFLRYSKNLAFYGIDTKKCLSLVSNDGAILTPEKLLEKKQLAKIQLEIDELKEKLIAAPNLIESRKYEKLLEWKVHDANRYGEMTYSIDSILQDVKKNKVNKRTLRDSLLEFQKRKNSI